MRRLTNIWRTVDDDKPAKKQKYALDPVCISAIWASGTGDLAKNIYGWTGDIGATCGAQWYYSNAVVGGDGFKPPCVVRASCCVRFLLIFSC